MPRPRFRTSRSFRGAKRPTTWEQIPSSFTRSSAAGQSILDISNDNIIDDESSGGTCIRMIGTVSAEHDLGAQAIETVEFGYGIAVITKDALAAGAVPDPLATLDQNQDWYFWKTYKQTLGPAGTDNGLIVTDINIRSARRLRGGYRLAFIMEKAITELGMHFHVELRMLWKLNA